MLSCQMARLGFTVVFGNCNSRESHPVSESRQFTPFTASSTGQILYMDYIIYRLQILMVVSDVIYMSTSIDIQIDMQTMVISSSIKSDVSSVTSYINIHKPYYQNNSVSVNDFHNLKYVFIYHSFFQGGLMLILFKSKLTQIYIYCNNKCLAKTTIYIVSYYCFLFRFTSFLDWVTCYGEKTNYV